MPPKPELLRALLPIHTERLILREWITADMDVLAAMHADAEVARYIGPCRPRSYEETRARFEITLKHYDQCGFGMWAVDSREGGGMIGRCGIQPHEDEIEIGWTFARASWGQGYATEAARAALDFAFRKVGIDRVVAFAIEENTRSVNVMRKLSMRFEFFLNRDGGKWVKYAITASDWNALRLQKGPA